MKSRRIRCNSLCTVALAGALVGLASHQTVRLVALPDRQTCQECTIEFTKGPVLGGGDGAGGISWIPSDAAVDSRGRVFLTSWDRGEMPRVFDSTGRFIQRLGREGQGPGELLAPNFIEIGAGDSIYVRDADHDAFVECDHHIVARVIEELTRPARIDRSVKNV